MSEWKCIDKATKDQDVFLGRWSESLNGERFWEVGQGRISDDAVMVSGVYRYSKGYFTHYRKLEAPTQ